ncbi:MAG TPA: hypothetical protein EYP59_02525 [Thiotrichaceae bacterium]|nr:hypothetical protein [Thiotrichaceae bacterium]
MLNNSLVQIVNTSEISTLKANKKGQWIEILFQGITLNFCLPNGKWKNTDIVMFYDPQTRLFNWYQASVRSWYLSPPGIDQLTALPYIESTISRYLENSYLYLTDNKMLYFKYNPWGHIGYKESTTHYQNLETGCEKTLLFIQENLRELEKYSSRPWNSSIELVLAKDVSPLFTIRRKKRGSSMVIPYKEIKLVEVSYQNAQWKLTLESADHKQTFLTLDENYQLIEVSGYGAISEEHYTGKDYYFDRID